MDVRQLKFPDAHFELLMDKGTLDSVLCGSNSTENAAQMLREAYRVLKPGGFYVLVTYGRPQLRMPYLEQPRFRWDIAHQTVAKTRFLYILRKLRDGERPALRPVVPSSK
jgi:ubiquinone/menaquinone biosynthesis C-methylase UbiE